MPLYEYKCDKCEELFFELRRASQREDPIACPDCGGEGKIVFSTFAQGSSSESCPSRGQCPSGST
jgi:putative FmdB family regulatory protein